MPQRPCLSHPKPLVDLGRTVAFAVALCWVTGGVSYSQPAETKDPAKPTEGMVTAVPEAICERYNLDREFYKKHIDYKGFSILSSAKVSDEALIEARFLIDQLLGDREDILRAMIKRGARFMVMAPTEMTTDVPEQRHMDKAYWDKRARGLGGRLSSCGEENLLNLPGDRYNRENILIHEFNHAVHNIGLREVDPTFDRRLREAYRKAMDKGLWKGTYLETNAGEYWAEGCQAYFDCMRPQYGANTREKLLAYDHELYDLVNEVYGRKETKILYEHVIDQRRLKLIEETVIPKEWRYVRYDKRNPPAPPANAPEPNANGSVGKDKSRRLGAAGSG